MGQRGSTSTFDEVAGLLRGASTVTVIGHIRPDADAVGSVAALVRTLGALGVKTNGMIGQKELFAENLYAIPGAQDIQVGTPLPASEFYVLVDCGSLSRAGDLAEELAEKQAQIIVIDHHDSNPAFGGHNIIDPHAESTTVLIRDLIAALGVDLNPDLAQAIYAGLVTDTGSFRWGSTRMHTLAVELMEHGVDPHQSASFLLDDLTVDDLRFITSVLAELREVTIAGLTVVIATADLASNPYEEDVARRAAAIERLPDYVRSLKGVDLGVVFKELSPGHWAVSLRATEGMDTSEIAAALGGGGHLLAAGYRTSGTTTEVHEELVTLLQSPGPWRER